MQIARLRRLPWLLVAAAQLVVPVDGAPPSGPIVSSCPAPMLARRAAPDDPVCVPSASRERAAAENAGAPLLWIPGPFGPKTCASGFVWREATTRDFICVTSAIRALVRGENANNPRLPAGQ